MTKKTASGDRQRRSGTVDEALEQLKDEAAKRKAKGMLDRLDRLAAIDPKLASQVASVLRDALAIVMKELRVSFCLDDFEESGRRKIVGISPPRARLAQLPVTKVLADEIRRVLKPVVKAAGRPKS
jgi:hypothetical protein